MTAEPIARPWRTRATSGAAGRLAGWLRRGRKRVALVVVREADFEDLADLDDAFDLAELLPKDGPARDASGDANALPAVPPQAPAVASGGKDTGDAGAMKDAPRSKRTGRHGRWV